MNQFKILPRALLSPGSKLLQHQRSLAGQTTLEDPALRVMTDFKQIRPLTISCAMSIEEANQKMILCGVRLLFVTTDEGLIFGLITATDILGEKPLKYLQEHGGTRSDILVQEIMTPFQQLDAISLTDVNNACVGDIVETMKEIGRQHVLVTETSTDNWCETVCGLISTTQIAMQLGIEVFPSYRANSFAEIGTAVLSSH